MAGENATLSYNFEKSIVSFKTRITEVAHSTNFIATESHARQHRAMYPHQQAPGRFAITCALKGYQEHKKFMEFLMGFGMYYMNLTGPKTPMMTVNIAMGDFSFLRVGAPVSGIDAGDHVGSMLFTPTVVFETFIDPLDTRTYTEQNKTSNVSQFQFSDNATAFRNGTNNNEMNDAQKFFYPMSPGSNDINTKAEEIYDYIGATAPTLPAPTPPPVNPTIPGA